MTPYTILTPKHLALLRMLIRYGLVGGVNTVLCFSLMYLGASMGLGYLAYTALAYSITIVLSFFMNLVFTFRVHGQLLKRLSAFILLSGCGLLMVEGIEYTLIELLHWMPWVAILCAMSCYTALGFWVNGRWIYRHRSSVRDQQE